ncbi:hypothetical protein pb186bvf_005530 [Paramecium bursaria]
MINSKPTLQEYIEKLKQIQEVTKQRNTSKQQTPKIQSQKALQTMKSSDRSFSQHKLAPFFQARKVSCSKRQTSQTDESRKIKTDQNKSPRSNEQIEMKKQLNNWFIKESKNNNTGGCLQLLEPTLVHNILKLPSNQKINPELRASLSAKDALDNTALHYAAKNGNSQLTSALIFKQVTIDAVNKELMSSLMVASYYGKDEVLLILINAGADINHQDLFGNTALHYGVKNGHKQIVQILLKKPSLQFKSNKDGKTADFYIQTEEIATLFKHYAEEVRKQQSKMSKVTIQTTQQDDIQKMFFTRTQKSTQIKSNIKTLPDKPTKLASVHSSPKLTLTTTMSTNMDSIRTQKEEEKMGPSHFQVIGLIGKGSFGEVYLVQRQGQLFAMKVLHKSRIMKNNLTRYAMTERNVLSITSHPFIVKLRCAFQTQDKLFMILDYCPGGDLGELLQKQKRLPEDLVKNYLCEIILALEDLHKRDIIFRDLKPDNIVIDAEGHVLLTDFGLSKEGIYEPHTGARSFCGSVAYLAPEMLKRCGHGKSVDWYLLGVVMYELLVGLPPYYANNREELFYNIENAALKIPSYISVEARNLLKSLLQRNPAKRLGSGKGDSDEVKAHQYFDNVDWENVYNRKLKLPLPQRKIRINTNMDGNVFDMQRRERTFMWMVLYKQ